MNDTSETPWLLEIAKIAGYVWVAAIAFALAFIFLILAVDQLRKFLEKREARKLMKKVEDYRRDFE